MCKLNPQQKTYFTIEVYTSDSKISKEDFEREVSERVLKAENELNADGKFRFHVWHEGEGV